VTNTLEVRSTTPHHCFATWDRVLVIIWRRDVTPEGLETLAKVGKAFVHSSSAPVTSLTIVESTSPPPSDKVRGVMSAFYREVAPFMKDQIVVAEGSGFRSALVRSIGVALSAISPKSLPFKFVGGIDEAATLLQPHLTRSAGGAEGLKSALRELRNKLR
jgi:hypothetical protein